MSERGGEETEQAGKGEGEGDRGGNSNVLVVTNAGLNDCTKLIYASENKQKQE